MKVLQKVLNCLMEETKPPEGMEWDELIICDDEHLSCMAMGRMSYKITFNYTDFAFGKDQEVCYPISDHSFSYDEMVNLYCQIHHKNARTVIRLTFPNHHKNVHEKLTELSEKMKYIVPLSELNKDGEPT